MTTAQRSLDIVFVVLGEGRGHMTQALALSSHLRQAGHRLTRVFVGTSKFRPIPPYFIDEIGAPVEAFEAPTLVPDAQGMTMSRWRTTLHTALHLPAFVRSVLFLRTRIRDLQPDVVVNFFDLLAGVARLMTRRGPTQIALAHNFLIKHPGSAVAPDGILGRHGYALLMWGVGIGARERLAPSFDPLPRHGILSPVPPLLREGLSDLPVVDGGFLLAYALNPGYAGLLARWQRAHPEVEVHCYVEGGEAVLAEQRGANFHLHALHGSRFLEHLARCRAYVGTAGFEAICEAFYLGKPVLAVPVEGHYEQRFNALDAHRSGAARAGTYHDLDEFWRDPPAPDPERVRAFRRWVDSAPEVFVRKMEDARD